LEVAIAARVACLVTGNKNHFPLTLCRGVTVLSPSDFLKFYKKHLKTVR
jgi:predicted nucleic acid-binding protein